MTMPSHAQQPRERRGCNRCVPLSCCRVVWVCDLTLTTNGWKLP
jgi:hypothetical protein